MSFSVMLDILKEKEKNKIVFIRCGYFYIAVGEDAIFLNKILNLKCTCFKNQVCKIGVPIDTLEKHLRRLNEKRYAYVVYDFYKEKSELIKQCEGKGKYHRIREKNKNCLLCKDISEYKDDKYLEALVKLLEKEKIEKESNIYSEK